MAEDKQATHQPAGISVRGVLWGGLAIAFGITLAALVAYLLWQRWDAPSGAQFPGAPNTGAVPTSVQPLLQSAPQQERAQYFAEKQRLIESWEWIDRQHGIARIPVEQAIRIMAARSGNKPAPIPGGPR